MYILGNKLIYKTLIFNDLKRAEKQPAEEKARLPAARQFVNYLKFID